MIEHESTVHILFDEKPSENLPLSTLLLLMLVDMNCKQVPGCLSNLLLCIAMSCHQAIMALKLLIPSA